MDAPDHRAGEHRGALAWALYDWGNSAFATTVMAGFFPIFFKQYWSVGVDAGTSTFRLGLANSLGSIAVALLAPVLGAIADAGRARKRFLLSFAAAGALATMALYLVGQGQWLTAALLFVFASVGFMGGNVFYDSLLLSVAAPGRRDAVSGLGYALGYLGGGLLFALNAWMVSSPGRFGLADAGAAVRVSFVMAGAWWALFSLPLAFFVPEPPGESAGSALAAVRQGLTELAHTVRRVRAYRPAAVFLLAYWLYIDGVDTMVRMAVDYGMAIGLASDDLILALLIIQFVGFPAALGFGWLGERIGPRRGILIGLFAFCVVTAWASAMDSAAEFYGLAGLVGLVIGGVQALSRSYYARLIPADRASEFFGFYNMLGKFAAVLGPLMVGVTSAWTGSPRLSLLVIVLLFVSGGAILMRVPEPAPE